MSHRCAGFTLVELLVVVSIIIVLLALLSPALSRAVYEARLVSCSANQKVLITSAIQYALEGKRYYPQRGNFRAAANVRAYLSVIGLTNSRASYDYRPTARLMGLNVNRNFQCAMVEPVNLENSLPNEWVSGNQAFWFGWHYTTGRDQNLSGIAGSVEHKGMFRLGDRFDGPDPRTDPNNPKVSKYNLLVADWDLWAPGAARGAQAAHPDVRKGTMYNWPAVRVPLNDALLTLSYWQGAHDPPFPPRGTLDNNFGYDDGSVRRVSEVEPNGDDRMAVVPSTQSADDGWHGLQIPRQ